ncbi:hypothetical protein ACIBL3_28580 [Kribbella sp. NPDC050124]|uniref:hypothetical protein n=1 Tax=Kribbella sp. NPDC050124 TaxID=3364114 RepID=UPI0037B235F3
MPITLSSRSVRRAALAGAAATLSIALTACGASFNAQTLQPYQAAEGTNADSGSIAVRNALVIASEDGKGELHAVIVNNGSTDDSLVGIAQAPAGTQDGQAGGDQPAEVTFGNVKPLDLKAGTSTLLPPAEGEEAEPTATPTPGSTETPAPTDGAITVTGAKPGQMVNMTITFGKAAPITAYVPVLTEDHYSPTPRADEGSGHG